MLCDTRSLGLMRVFRMGAFALAVALPLCGCSSGVTSARAPLSLFSGASADDEALKKRAEADKFPTAQQAGVVPAKSD